MIRKDYPLTGVLKLFAENKMITSPELIRKDYPLTGVLKRNTNQVSTNRGQENQEGLPAYWGIETTRSEAPR